MTGHIRGSAPTPKNTKKATDNYVDKGEFLIWYLWNKGTDRMKNMRDMKTDESSYLQRYQ